MSAAPSTVSRTEAPGVADIPAVAQAIRLLQVEVESACIRAGAAIRAAELTCSFIADRRARRADVPESGRRGIGSALRAGEVAALRSSMSERSLLARATGLLMASERRDEEEAFTRLVSLDGATEHLGDVVRRVLLDRGLAPGLGSDP